MAQLSKPKTQWLAQVQEEIVDPERVIIDPHHHLWTHEEIGVYLVDELHKDTSEGPERTQHNVTKTVFIECGSKYLHQGPEHLRSTGETAFVAEQAIASDKLPGPAISAIVSHADLTLGDDLKHVLEAHEQLGKGRFRGIRHAGAHARYPDTLMIPGGAPADLYAKPEFRAGVKKLGSLGYTYDTWHYHYQNQDFYKLAKAVPDTQMILDHFGTPLGVGIYTDQKKEIFKQWKIDIKTISQCENVVAKLGGLAMPDNGFGWEQAAKPPSSDEFVEAQREYYLHAIDCFGPERCMFESNFPVDKYSISYHVLFNGLKKMVADFSDDEKDTMFHRTAARIYRI